MLTPTSPTDSDAGTTFGDDEQMTLEKAFEELRRGIDLVKAQSPELPNADQLTGVLEEVLALYSAGDETHGVPRLMTLKL